MAIRKLVGNERLHEALCHAIVRDRLPHALLFAGPDGVGKRTTALELAKAVTCETPQAGDACDACPSCLRADSKEHSDIRVFEPDGAFLKIAQMRDMAREAQYHPFEGRRRVIVVDRAHQMRDEAANAILKTLEEPPPTSLIVLVTDQPYAILETIRSRCQTLRFAPVPAEEIERYLAANYRRPSDETRLLSRIAAGRIGRALATDLSVYREHRKEMLGLIEVLADDADRLRLMKAAQYLGDVGKKDKSAFDARLDLFVALCRDLYALALGGSTDDIANVDVALRLQQVAGSVTPARIASWVEAVNRLREQLRQNVNRQLALESVLLGIEKASARLV